MRGETIQVLSPGGRLDPYSQETVYDDWDNPVPMDVTTLAPPEPRPSQEPVQDARNALISGWTLYLPAGTAITAANRVKVRGVVYPVQGKPADWGRGVVVQAFSTEG